MKKKKWSQTGQKICQRSSSEDPRNNSCRYCGRNLGKIFFRENVEGTQKNPKRDFGSNTGKIYGQNSRNSVKILVKSSRRNRSGFRRTGSLSRKNSGKKYSKLGKMPVGTPEKKNMLRTPGFPDFFR